MFLHKPLRGSLALVLACGLASLSRAIVPTARSETAQETAIGPADAADALARMGKTLSARQFSFRSRIFRFYAGPNGELLHIAHTTKTIYDQPDRLSVSVTGDNGSIKILYDGKTLVLYASEAKQYVSAPVTGSIEKDVERGMEDQELRGRMSYSPIAAVSAGLIIDKALEKFCSATDPDPKPVLPVMANNRTR
jgi:hypothetical protein